MYFWKIDKLKDQIKAGKLNEKDRFYYAIAHMLFYAFTLETFIWVPINQPNMWVMADSIANILISVVGLIQAFKANGGRQGHDFLGKLASIGWVMYIRFYMYILPLLLLVLIYSTFGFYKEISQLLTSGWLLLLSVIWKSAMWWRICIHMRDVGSHTQSA